MIAEFGLAALWLAAALAALQLLAGWMGTRAGGEGFARVVRPVAVVQALLCLTAFASLLLLFYIGWGYFQGDRVQGWTSTMLVVGMAASMVSSLTFASSASRIRSCPSSSRLRSE